MNIVKSDAKFQVYGMEIATYDKLPVDVYDLNFNKMQGFFLTQRNPLTVSEKIYGNSLKRAEKILRTFNNTNRNFGVILSGRKGIGKTMFARLLAEKVMGVGIPVINISSYLPGLSSFLESLQQEVMVFFLMNSKRLFVVMTNMTHRKNCCLFLMVQEPGKSFLLSHVMKRNI